MKIITILFISLIIFGCSESRKRKSNQYLDLIVKVQNVADSISIGQMTIQNGFKHQILAHSLNDFDSLRIFNKLGPCGKHREPGVIG